MGGSSMQRSNGSMRTVMAVCLGVIVLLTFLYLMKRSETSQANRNLDMVKVESRNLEEQLNSKIVTYVEKIESVSQEVAVTGGQLKQCRDEKAIGIAESSKVKSSLSTCLEDRDKVQSQMAQSAQLLEHAKQERDSALDDKGDAEDDMQDLEREKADLESQNEACEKDSEQLQADLQQLRREADTTTCADTLANAQLQVKQLQSQVQSQSSQIQSLTREKNALNVQADQFRSQLSHHPVGIPPSKPRGDPLNNSQLHPPQNSDPSDQQVEDEIMKLLQGEAEEDEKDDNDENYFMKKYPSHEKDGTPGGDEERAGDRAGGPYA